MKFNNDRRIRGEKRTKMKVYCSCGHKTQGSPKLIGRWTKKESRKAHLQKKTRKKVYPGLCFMYFRNNKRTRIFWLLFFLAHRIHSFKLPPKTLSFRWRLLPLHVLHLLSLVLAFCVRSCPINIFLYVNNSWPQTATTKFCLSPHTFRPTFTHIRFSSVLPLSLMYFM